MTFTMTTLKKSVSKTLLLLILVYNVSCCDLEQFFSDKEFSVEDSVASSHIVFRGISIEDLVKNVLPANTENDVERYDKYPSEEAYTIKFELLNTYKGAKLLSNWGVNTDRIINITVLRKPVMCSKEWTQVPREYIIFCNEDRGVLLATAMAPWDEVSDQRVWSALGWGEWSQWSACSTSCSSGIQQRQRHCLTPECSGYNIEQRYCNLFGCQVAVEPLALANSDSFHPSKERWSVVPDRPSAWRLHPNSYVWLPSTPNMTIPSTGFALFITLRVENETMGTIVSMRSRSQQDSYLSIEADGADVKLFHASPNGTDFVRIYTGLNDANWHQIAISIRDNCIVTVFVDCEWEKTELLGKNSFQIPKDGDLIIGYLFSGDLEQLTIVSDPSLVNLQCSSRRTPIVDNSISKNYTLI